MFAAIDFSPLILPAAIMAFACTLGISITMVVMMKRMQGDHLIPLHPDDPKWRKLHESAESSIQWAVHHGFTILGYFRVPSGGLILLWERRGDPTFLAHYFIQRQIAIDLYTVFENSIGLTTCSSSSSHLFPKRPGSYCQSAASTLFDEIFAGHCEALEYLVQEGARLKSGAVDGVAQFNASIVRSLEFVRAQPLWPIRAIAWYWFRRRRWHGVPIAEQVRRGWVPAPARLIAAQ
ncbi:MAG: hypothetical protein IT450_14385 [Phycisphaerales bacterium]|nr:hypothetical protein [Phycisphaerales bacterium]